MPSGISIMKAAVIDGALAVLGPAEDVGKAAVPQDLVRQVRGAGTDPLNQRLVDTAGDHDDLGVLLRQLFVCHAV